MNRHHIQHAEALAQEYDKLDTEMTPGKWSVWTSNSFRRITTFPDGPDGGVLHGTVQCHDGHPDLGGRNLMTDLAGICILRNSASQARKALQALLAEIHCLEDALDKERNAHQVTLLELEALRGRAADLTKEKIIDMGATVAGPLLDQFVLPDKQKMFIMIIGAVAGKIGEQLVEALTGASIE